MTRKEEFYMLAVVIGLVQGGIQALSRSYYARLIPPDKPAEFFDAVTSLVTSGTAPIDAVTPMDEDLEAVFRYLTQ